MAETRLVTRSGRLSRPARSLVAALAAVLALTLATTPAAADEEDDLIHQNADYKARIDELEALQEDVSADLVAAAIALEATESQIPAATERLTAATAAREQAVIDVAAARSTYDDVAGRLNQAEAEQVELAGEIDSSEQVVADSRRVLGAMARETVRGQVHSPELVVLLSDGQELREVTDSFVVTSTVAQLREQKFVDANNELSLARNRQARLSAVAEEIGQLKLAAADALAAAELAEQVAAEAEEAAEQAKAALDVLAAAQAKQQADLEAQKQAYAAEESGLEADMAANSARLAEIAAERKKAAAAAAAASGGSASGPAITPGFFGAPLPSLRMTSPYGSRFHPIWREWRFHAGTDFGAGCGTPIYASAAGTVLYAGWGGGYGNRTEVSHGIMENSLMVTSYNHQSAIGVSVGQEVTKGELIGYVGTTGSSTGCHLHFEIYADGSTVDPMAYLS